MNARERIVEQIEMSQKAKNGVSKYSNIELPERVIIRTETVEEGESTKNGRKIPKRLEENSINEMKNALNSDIAKALDLLEEKIPISKKLDAIYYIEMAVGGIISVSTVIFYQALGLMAIPMIILGLGMFFTSFASKRKINRVRKEYGI